MAVLGSGGTLCGIRIERFDNMLTELDYKNAENKREFRYIDERSNCMTCDEKTDNLWNCGNCSVRY
jgi:queuine/archaeosine tRNA-ribosyltransferase